MLVELPILCRLWSEDDVWNAVAEDLPVAVSGDTFEEALQHLTEAIALHLKVAHDLGIHKDLIDHLSDRARDHGVVRFDEITPRSAIVKLLAAVKDHEDLALAR